MCVGESTIEKAILCTITTLAERPFTQVTEDVRLSYCTKAVGAELKMKMVEESAQCLVTFD
jgi:hypothetical protein